MIEIPLAALGIAAITLLGRGILAWLPAGQVGSHRIGELSVTWAASYLLGCIAIAAAASAGALAGLSFSCAWIGGAGALVGLARWATLPARIVPRHEVLRETPSAAARAAWVLAGGIAAWACWHVEVSTATDRWAMRAQGLLSQGEIAGLDDPAKSAFAASLLDSASVAFAAWPSGQVTSIVARAHLLALFFAALLLAERAMATARRAPAGRRGLIVLLAVALAPAATPEAGDLASAALIALVSSGMVAWTRRADARGMALACAGACALFLVQPGGWVLGFAGLSALLAASARPGRKRVLLWELGCFAILSLAWPLAARTRGAALFGGDPLSALSSSWALDSESLLAIWIAPIWIAFGTAVGPAVLRLFHPPGGTPLDASDPDRPQRDLAALGLFALALLLAVILSVALSGVSPGLIAKTWAPGLLVQTAPLAAVLAARTLVRAERVH